MWIVDAAPAGATPDSSFFTYFYTKRKQSTNMAAGDEENNVSIMSKTILLSATDDNFGDSSYPLVFTCEKCHQIVGDSNSWVCMNKDLRAITLMRTRLQLFLSLIHI